MKALVIGGATVDVITMVNPSDIECITMKNATTSYLMMEQGKKVEASRIETHPGGGACNASVALARLGADVASVLKLGNDVDADRILARLNEERIDTRYVKRELNEQTGKSIIVSSHDRNSGVFVHRGANTTLCLDDLPDYIFQGIDLVYVSTLSKKSADAFPAIVEKAKKAGAFVACNPGIRQIRQRKDQVLSALKHVDLCAINKEEAQALAEGFVEVSERDEDIGANAPRLIAEGLGERGTYISLSGLAQKLQDIGCSHLVVTNGSEGAYLAYKNAVLFRPAIKIQVESTIGAGDAFNATISYALMSKQTVYSALNMAAANAAAVAGGLDAQSALMSAEALKKKILGMDSSRIQSYPLASGGTKD